MSFALDPELLTVLEQVAAGASPPPLPARGDWMTRRENISMGLRALSAQLPSCPDVVSRSFSLPVPGGAIELRWYERKNSSPGSAVVHAHGGGMIAGDLDAYGPFVERYVNATGVPFLAVEFRYAPEFPGTVAAEDCLAAVRWLGEHASELGVDPDRVAVLGDSGGGAVAAWVALLARDQGVPLAAQILIYPMLDDRTLEPDPYLAPLAWWSYDDNFTCWSAVLGTELERAAAPAVVSPARAVDLTGVAPAYIEVGQLDILRDEAIEYARRLSLAGVTAELHVHPGAPHGYDLVAPDTSLCQRAFADRHRVIKAL